MLHVLFGGVGHFAYFDFVDGSEVAACAIDDIFKILDFGFGQVDIGPLFYPGDVGIEDQRVHQGGLSIV